MNRKEPVAVRLSVRLIVTAAIIALVAPPLFLLSDFGQKTPKKRPGAKAPVLPAPLPYDFSDKSGSLSAASRVFSAGSSLADYVSAPELPEGFENASPESPLSRDLAGVLRGASERILGSPAKAATNAAGDPSYDFDGDGKADMSVWNPSSSEWSVSQSNGQGTVSEVLGTSSSSPVPGDYDGDSKTDMAVFASGAWLAKPSAGGADLTHSFGTAGDVPVPGDYDGGGKTDWAVFRPSTSTWWVQSRETGAITSTAFGAAGDIPVQGNFDGDSKTDLAVFRPSTGDWHVLGTTAGYYAFHWGVATDTPVPADYDGDGKTDFAVFRPSTGTWYAHHSDGSGYTAFPWGNFGDQPAPADFDGDSKADFAVWRPTTGVWFVHKSATNAYAYESLGMNGDVPAQAAYVRKVGGFYAEYDFAKDRLSPKNATGGTDLYSGNVSWGAGLAGLPGRAGMSAGIGISYNSLVWTKDTKNSVMVFDADASNVSPGFTLGFGAIEPVYWDKANGRFAYLMTTPSGTRIEFRQIGATNAYETKDSSYALLETFGNSNPNDPVETITIAVTSSGGTKTEYAWNSGAFRPSKTTDRNGNFVSVSHNQYGLLESFADTLGRVVSVGYDSALRPVSVTQQWRDQNGSGSPVTRTYAEFEYSQTAVDPSFDQSLGVFGPDGGTLLTVLSKVTYGTSSSNTGSTSFEYNSFGQVSKITNRAGDGHILSYSRTNLETPGTGLMDVPKLSETRNWTENFNLDQNGSEQETVFRNTIATGAAIPAAGGGGTGTKIEAWMEGHPTSNRSISYVGGSGWMESLPILSEDWADDGGGLERKRWSATQWTQDDTNLSRPDNPRATVSRIGDDDNGYVRRTETTYRLYPNSTVSEYGLVEKTELFDESSPSVVLKRAETDYNLSAAYVSRRIIGLVSEARAYGLENGNLELASRTTFEYDHEGFTEETNQTVSPSAGHDNANYGASFVAGRGNQTSATRWDADDSQNQTKAITTVARYDTAGSAVASIDPMGRKIRIEYSDSFNDSSNPGTYAYPTKVFDPAGNFSRVKYRFDTGANVWADSPHPSDANDRGKETEREYDGFGRILRETLVNNGAYTRYEYPSAAVESRVYTTVVDMNGDGPDASDEVLSRAWTDGAGRTLETRTLHPGSTGGYAGSIAEYNEIGELVRSTVPTEVDSSGNPAGDDYRGAGVWLWNQREYDWKGRVTREINTDGTDRLISYEGCGCAGGQVTTVKGELVPRDDQPLVNARRTQKVYSDILGRNYKTEVFKWDGSTVYSRTEQTYDRRDAATKTRQTAVSETGQPYQDVDMTYDGFGRMKTRHYPIEDAGTYTEWFYNADGSNSQIIDPRGAAATFAYSDPRGLLTNVTYQAPSGSGIQAAPSVTFAYDSVGNRISMDDGPGDTTYEYDELSRLVSESRYFDDLPNAPVSGNRYEIGYSYDLAGQIASVTDPFGYEISYDHGITGAVDAVSSTPTAANPTGALVGGVERRAFGGAKEVSLAVPGESAGLGIDYDARLRPSHVEVASTTEQSGYLENSDISYNADSRVSARDELNIDRMDSITRYDFAGRLTLNRFPMVDNNDNLNVRLYEENLSYDGFSMLTSRTGQHWGTSIGFTETYINGRIQNRPGMTYDEAGNIVETGDTYSPHDYQSTEFDASGRKTMMIESVKGRWGSLLNMVTVTKTQFEFDGAGNALVELRGVQFYHAVNDPPPASPPTASVTAYQVWSTVLNEALTKLTPQGAKLETRFEAASGVRVSDNVLTGIMSFSLSGAGSGAVSTVSVSQSGVGGNVKQYEPLGQEISIDDPAGLPDPPQNESVSYWMDMEWGCRLPDPFRGDFFSMPTHCAIQLATESWNPYPMDLSPWFPKKGNKVTRYVITPVYGEGGVGGSKHSLTNNANAMTFLFGSDRKLAPTEFYLDGLYGYDAEYSGETVATLPDIKARDIARAVRLCAHQLWGNKNRVFDMAEISSVSPGKTDGSIKFGITFNEEKTPTTTTGKLNGVTTVTSDRRTEFQTFKQDGTSFSGAELARMHKSEYPSAEQFSFLGGFTTKSGKSYVATDVGKSDTALGVLIDNNGLALQIHEAGIQLGQKFGAGNWDMVNSYNSHPNSDEGIKFEECVFVKLKELETK
ncbi:MAG: FG-GAP-like repeat-containing protein [Pyrinomonadaceae bacterium]